MPDRPKHNHYNDEHATHTHLPRAEGRDAIDGLRETPRAIVGAWIVRVAVMAAALWLLDYLLGPFGWTWWALLAYAALSLTMSLVLNRLKNRQLDRIEQIYDEEDARHFR